MSGGRAWAAVALLVALSTALRGYAASRVHGPWIAPDETVYALLGQSLYRHGSLAILGGPTPFYSLVVPVLVGPFLSLHDLELGYSLLKPFLALVMSLAAVPVFAWASTVTSRRWALAAAALTLAVPGLAYSGLVMSEVAFYPVLTLAAWTAARTIAVPTPGRIALLALAFAFAVLTRLQALVLAPVLVVALLLDAAFAHSWGRLRRTAPVLAAAVLPALAWLVVQQVRGEPLLGAYESVAGSSYHVHDAARFVLFHAGALVLTTGVVPACALLALAAGAALRGERDPLRRATIAVTLALAGGVVVQVGVFASQHVGQIAGRDLLCVAPSLFVCLAVWLGGAPVGGRIAAAAAIVAFLTVASLPFEALAAAQALPDELAFAPFQGRSAHTLTLLVLAASACAALAFVLLPRRAGAAIVAVLLVAGAAASVSSSRAVIRNARATRAALAGPEPRWVDAAAHGRAATYVYDGNRDWPAVWEALFWNRGLTRVVTIDGATLPGPAPARPLRIRPDGGLGEDNPLLVLPSSFAVAGTPLADAAQSIPGQAGLRVWQVVPPARVTSRTLGLQSNGDIYKDEPATIVAYGCASGTWQLTLIPKEAQDVAILQDGKPLQELHFTAAQAAAGHFVNLDLPVRAHAGATCRLDVEPTGLLGTTRFGFAPG